MSAIHDTRAKPLEFKLISELFDHGMDRLISAEARILHDEEGIAFVDDRDFFLARVRPDVSSSERIAASVRIFSDGLSCPAMLSASCLSG